MNLISPRIYIQLFFIFEIGFKMFSLNSNLNNIYFNKLLINASQFISIYRVHNLIHKHSSANKVD